MTTKTILKNQKPIDLDLHLKYECSNCNAIHWLSLKETQTKNYKILCDCNCIIKPKTVDKVKLTYINTKKVVKQQHSVVLEEEIPVDLLKKCVTMLTGYGFEKDESENLTKEYHKANPNLNCVDLIKHILKSFGSDSNEQYSSNNI